ncbi:hypothetical protein [Streptomyces sp. NPDC058674]|uniref:hypothetical protein n=1 Tax=Streptomyces sp. NPDC058674 TaxID=3346592 RepID=UPI00365DB345
MHQYRDLREEGLWRPRWSASTKENLRIAELGISDLQAKYGTMSVEVARAEHDEAVLQSNITMTHGWLDVEVVAECLPPASFENSGRLRVIDELTTVPGTPLVLRVVPSPVCPLISEDLPYLDFIRQYGILVSPRELDYVVGNDNGLRVLISGKLHRGLSERRSLRDFEIEEPQLRDYARALNAAEPTPIHGLSATNQLGEALVSHPKRDHIKSRLLAGRDVMVVGPSSSGKSTLILQIAELLQDEAMDVYKIDLGEPHLQDITLANYLLFEAPKKSIILVDDLQSNPSCAELILGVIALRKEVRPYQSSEITLCATSWREYSHRAKIFSPSIHAIPINPHQVTAQILRRFGVNLSHEVRSFLGERYGEDLNLLRLAIRAAGGSADQNELDGVIARSYVQNLYDECDPSESRASAERILLVTATLGRYDIPVSRNFLLRSAAAFESDLDALTTAGNIRTQGTSIRLGHRSLCGLLTEWLTAQGAWNRCQDAGGVSSAEMAVTAYLESLPADRALEALRAICARADFRDEGALDERARYVVDIWSCFNALVERLHRQQEKDATWGRTPSSCMYAFEALTAIGAAEAARPSIEFLRRVCVVDGQELKIDTEALATKEDFEQIRIRMLAAAGNDVLRKRRVEGTDMDRMHRAWASGVYLCAEALADSEYALRHIVPAVEEQQLPCGAFYPPEVPWVTARVLLGLGTAGLTVETSRRVRKAADWLAGVSRGGVWESGTGSWNSAIETTAMSLVALAHVGDEFENLDRNLSVAFLRSSREVWMSVGAELDGALAIRALLDAGTPWDEIAPDAATLSARALQEVLWKTAAVSASDSFAQSCKTAQISTDLLSIGWFGVRDSISELLAAMDVRANTQ